MSNSRRIGQLVSDRNQLEASFASAKRRAERAISLGSILERHRATNQLEEARKRIAKCETLIEETRAQLDSLKDD